MRSYVFNVFGAPPRLLRIQAPQALIALRLRRQVVSVRQEKTVKDVSFTKLFEMDTYSASKSI